MQERLCDQIFDIIDAKRLSLSKVGSKEYVNNFTGMLNNNRFSSITYPGKMYITSSLNQRLRRRGLPEW